jgi:predicted CXXCH cytochrome family protein
MHVAGFNFGTLANPDICGQCHSRYGKTVATYTYTPYPGASPATIQPQYPVGYNPFPTPAPSGPVQPLSAVLNIPLPGTPVSQIFWPAPITAAAKSHGDSADQYEEMMQNRFTGTGSPAVTHFNSLDSLKAIGQGTNTQCLECHSADYQIQVEAGATPDPSQLKFGDTCVTCHDPHAAGAQQSVFNSGRNPQLVAPQSTLCTKCHNTEIGTPNVTKTSAPLRNSRSCPEVPPSASRSRRPSIRATACSATWCRPASSSTAFPAPAATTSSGWSPPSTRPRTR